MRLREAPVPAPKQKAAPCPPRARTSGQSHAAQIAGRLAAIQLRKTDAGAPQPRAAEPAPRRNETGLPDRLKAGVEALSGLSLDDARVHYGSSKPAQLQAYAYTQGTEIHVAPGQERHLAHEAWHVVQQKQGRVRPTVQLFGIQLNDDSALEREADRFGDLAAAASVPATQVVLRKATGAPVVQCATVDKSGYAVSLTEDFTKNHLRSSWLAARNRSIKRGLAKSTIINEKQANVKTVVEGSDFDLWKTYSEKDERYYQKFDLPHWLTTYANDEYTTSAERTSALWLGAYFNNVGGKKTTKVTHIWG
jgi:hypothetical protein